MSSDERNYGVGVNAADILAFDWEQVCELAARRTCSDYYSVLREKAGELGASGDLKGEQVFSLLASLASYSLSPDNPKDPYQPMFSSYARRSSVPDDLRDSDLDALGGILSKTENPEFRARIADVLWLRKKDHKSALAAIGAFLESAANLTEGCTELDRLGRLERASQLSNLLGRPGDFHERVAQVIDDAIRACEETKGGLLRLKLTLLLIKHDEKAVDLEELLLHTTEHAERLESLSEWHSAHEYWGLASKIARRTGADSKVDSCGLKIAHCYQKIAESFLEGDKKSFLGASAWIAKALDALRFSHATVERIEAMHALLLDYQKRGMGEVQSIEFPYPNQDELRAMSQKAREFVSVSPFSDAVLRLAGVTQPTRPEDVQGRVEDPSPGVFSQLFGASTIRSTGQVSASRPPLLTDDPDARLRAVQGEMFNQARNVDWPMKVKVIIEPARQDVVARHPARLVDLEFIVRLNPFIPSGREGLYLRGLHAGLHGDLVLSLHLLLPQLENSIRFVLCNAGVVTSKLDSDDSQDERDLGWLLYHPKIAEVFGDNLVFDMRGLFVERFGMNLRNDLAHGLLDETQIHTPCAVYAWWLIFRLCCSQKIPETPKEG